MVVNKRKKVTKYRAHTTHGGGHRKKRRGAGSRGGRGNAGTGKRAGHRKAGGRVIPGKHGFLPRSSKEIIKAINLNYFTSNRLDKLAAAGKISKEGGVYFVDLGKLGYQKLLGLGTVSLKLKIKVASYSAKAAEKLKSAGGMLVEGRVKEQAKEKTIEKALEKEE